MTYIYKILLVVMVIMLSGCPTSFTTNMKKQEQKAENLRSMIPCPADRPLNCPPGDGPACGILQDGSGWEYSSGCMACTRRVVVGYIPGGCAIKRHEIVL